MALKAMGDTMAGRIQEGDAHYKEADGLTTKTFTRWKPEWVGAALGFEKAVKCYKAGKSLEKQVDANQRWAQALCESNAFYNAGNDHNFVGPVAYWFSNSLLHMDFCKSGVRHLMEADHVNVAGRDVGAHGDISNTEMCRAGI